jgi:enediyne biosynthesis protein E4
MARSLFRIGSTVCQEFSGENRMNHCIGWRRPAIVTSIVVAGFLWGGWKSFQGWHYHQSITQIVNEMDRGLSSLAARHAMDLLAIYPDADEALLLLGDCEKARGQSQAAARAWAKITQTSPFAFDALESRVTLMVEEGRLIEAEQLILRALDGPQMTGRDPTVLLVQIYLREGRVPEALQRIETTWQAYDKLGEAATEPAINLLRLHIHIRSSPVPDETARTALDQLGRIAPDDDQVWLWKANLAIRTTAYDAAATWIGRCLEKRPEDVAVWEARLRWAMATRHTSLALKALKHLPVAGFDLARIEKLAAWFANQRGEYDVERKSLDRLIAIAPTDFEATDRLIEIHMKDGQPAEANRLGQRKKEIAQLQSQYLKLHMRYQPRRDAEEMARLAERLGYHFEAKAFLTIALADSPARPELGRDLARIATLVDDSSRSARALLDRLSRQLDDPGGIKKP